MSSKSSKPLTEERLAEIRKIEAIAKAMDMGNRVRQELIAEVDRLRALTDLMDRARDVLEYARDYGPRNGAPATGAQAETLLRDWPARQGGG